MERHVTNKFERENQKQNTKNQKKRQNKNNKYKQEHKSLEIKRPNHIIRTGDVR